MNRCPAVGVAIDKLSTHFISKREVAACDVCALGRLANVDRVHTITAGWILTKTSNTTHVLVYKTYTDFWSISCALNQEALCATTSRCGNFCTHYLAVAGLRHQITYSYLVLSAKRSGQHVYRNTFRYSHRYTRRDETHICITRARTFQETATRPTKNRVPHLHFSVGGAPNPVSLWISGWCKRSARRVCDVCL